MSTTVLLIEDDVGTVDLIARALHREDPSIDVASAPAANRGLRWLGEHSADCVLLDYRLPDGDGLGCLRAIRRNHPDVPVVMLTGAGSEEVAVQAMKLGALDYVVKEGRYLTRVPLVVREAIGRRLQQRATEYVEPSLRLSDGVRAGWHRAGIVWRGPALEQTVALAERAASTTATVLLEGETGTGKELFARAIHDRGRPTRGPFVSQNCAALPETLLESELFGHVRGAFSGADRERHGLFQDANGGTLFLDEVSETSAAMQAKLLRVLQDGEMRPLGTNAVRRVDVRVIAASNRDLNAWVRKGRFRLDLLHRLRVLFIRIPPLRERRGDIPLLAARLLAELAAIEGKRGLTLDKVTVACLSSQEWPGNVRELRNEIHRLVLGARDNEHIMPSLLSPWLVQTGDAFCNTRPLKELVHDVEVAIIHDRLRMYEYHRGATARSLGMTREGLWQKLKQIRLRVPERRGS